MTSRRARVAHVFRRLSMGPQPDLAADVSDPQDAIARALDLSAPPATPPTIEAPPDYERARVVSTIAEPITWWIGQMKRSPRLIEERLVWFWHDHFATGLQKVRVPYLMWQQHLLVRAHATGNFATLLKAISRDPAMLVYLDGISNSVRERNENFGREAMELFTTGRGPYTEQDVVEASRAFTGWVVNLGRGVGPRAAQLAAIAAPWTAAFVPARFDGGTKTLLGTTGNLDMDGALDVLLGHEATADHLATKLYRELIGVPPSPRATSRLGRVLRDADYEIMPLVEAIVGEDAFLADDSIGAKVRTPLEQLVGLVQAFPPEGIALGAVGPRRGRRGGVGDALRTLGYVPFVPPNVAGFPSGSALLGPDRMVHTLDLLSVFPDAPTVPATVDELLARFALYDVSRSTRRELDRGSDPTRRLAVLVASPEYAVV